MENSNYIQIFADRMIQQFVIPLIDNINLIINHKLTHLYKWNSVSVGHWFGNFILYDLT